MKASISKPGSNGPSRRRVLRTLVVLGYHKVGDPPPGSWETWYLVPEETFRRQLDDLRRHRWEVVDLARFLMGLDELDLLPERAALITFDDGYRSIRDAALRSLREFGYPGVLFVPSDYIGRTNDFEADTDEPREQLCDVDDLRELERNGISVQSHCASHRPFSSLGVREQVDELAGSKATLERALGNRVHTLSYPYGDPGRDPDAAARFLRRLDYRAAFLYGGGRFAAEAASRYRYRLPRLAVGPDTDLAEVLGG
jgi:peptidoglycan/xylan/chitin deacetylase (PgdA/CDA1 family)